MDPHTDQLSEPDNAQSPPNPHEQTIWEAWRIGVMGFGFASMAVFGSWAFLGRWFYSNLGEAGAYVAWLIMYLGIGGEIMKKLIPGKGSRWRFQGIFSSSFAAYAVLWICVWMIFRNRTGEALAAVFGSLAMAIVICAAFKNMSHWKQIWMILTLSNASGYFIGSWLHALMGMPWGALAWGVSYGFLFGCGIGPSFWIAQNNSAKTEPFSDPV